MMQNWNPEVLGACLLGSGALGSYAGPWVRDHLHRHRVRFVDQPHSNACADYYQDTEDQGGVG